ncbi:hypothetical protein [Paraburkholderia kirstenboschensis]|uniref:SMODS and SLOG-associating 2TM effector domain-containing protein n=1 Tax=Paraburkholderia kirstenboschensis TaxID=1245436 RepID=A0ABZ0EP63_9BURK|nr:hypothetical protein [Paraburkholderia kirstenboschensis]WOD18976.1 hypothetical protein RW095_40600 [Paraburkholderia kirstenboschensis]
MDQKERERKWDGLLFGIRRSIRYHQRRRAFFDRMDQLSNVSALVFGSAAIYGVLDKDYHALALLASAAVTAFSSVNLVFGSSQRARAHHDFARSFHDLERSMLCDPSDDALRLAESRRLEIEANEPPVLRVLDCMCHNEQMRAEGYPTNDLAHVRWWQRLLAQFVDVREDLIHAAV